MFRFVKDFTQNAKALMRALALRSVEHTDIRAEFPTIFLTFLTYVVALAALDYPWGDPGAHFNFLGLANLALMSLGFLLLCVLCTVVMGLRAQAAAVYVLLLMSWLLLALISDVLEAVPVASDSLAMAAWGVTVLAIVWSHFAVLFALSPGRLRSRIFRAGGFVVLVVGGLFYLTAYVSDHLPEEQLFYSSTDFDEEDDYDAIDTESVYYQQPTLMSEQLGGMTSSAPGQSDLFVLAAGGYAYQRVFAREVEAVPASLASQFGPELRQIKLLNSVVTPDLYPLANRTNLEHAFGAMAKRMQEEDVALIYLTSHGYPHEFNLNFWEMRMEDLSSADLAAMLDRSGLKNVVIVISACYSGSFIHALKAEDRMIVTASSETATSFGCSDESEWTWFGRSLFEQALPQTSDFRQAFDLAKTQVAKWEAEEGLEPSNPQIWIGEGMDAVLDQFHAYQSAQAK